MAEIKTKKTGEDPRAFIKRIEDSKRREDCTSLLNLFKEVTGSKAVMWGPGIVGFGDIGTQRRYDGIATTQEQIGGI